MKKLSFSLVAILAIVFAVSSAFKTTTSPAGWYKVTVLDQKADPSVIEEASDDTSNPILASNCDSGLENLCLQFFPEDVDNDGGRSIQGGPYSAE